MRALQLLLRMNIVAALVTGLAVGGLACGGRDSGSRTATVTQETSTATRTQTPPPETPTAVAASVTPVLPTPGPTKSVTPAPIDAPSAAVRRIEGTRAVFLTFDAGAGRGYAMEILDLLAAAGAKASFGLTGTWASENPDIVRRIFREGHTVINHSYDHPSFTGSSSTYVALDRDERLDQLARTETVFASIVPNATSLPYFRPPFGDYDEEVLNDVGGAGYRYTLLWAIDSGGWRDLPVQEIVARVSAATSGDIVILHVASTGDFEALAEILDGLLSRGLSSAAIGDVLR